MFGFFIKGENKMSDETTLPRKLSYEEMSFLYDAAVRTAIKVLFEKNDQHGWTEQEFNQTTDLIIAAEQQKLITRWVN